MQHHRGLLYAVGIHVFQVELGRQAEVQLAGGQGVFRAHSRLHIDIQLGAVEGGLTDLLGEVDTQLRQHFPQSGLGLVPHGIIGMILDLVLGVPEGKDAAVVGNAEILVDIGNQVHDPGYFILDLVGGDKQMGIVLAEVAAPLNALQGAAGLVAEIVGDLADPDGQLPVGVGAIGVDHHVVRAVHGPQDEALAVHFHSREHIVLVVGPVAGGLVQGHGAYAGSHDVLIAQLPFLFLDIVFQLLPHRVASGQEHGQTAANQLVGHKQAHFLADLPMIPGFGLFLLLEILVQLLLGEESHAVDPGQHLVVGIVFPVSAGLLGELEGLQTLGVGQVGADAHVDIVALLIEADDGILGQIADVLFLIFCVTVVHELDGLVPRQDEGLDGQIGLDDLLHLFFNGLQILVCQLLVAKVHVVVEALFSGGAVSKVRIGVQMLNGLGHDVGSGVAQNVLGFFGRALGNGTVFVNDFHGFVSFFECRDAKRHPWISKGA